MLLRIVTNEVVAGRWQDVSWMMGASGSTSEVEKRRRLLFAAEAGL